MNCPDCGEHAEANDRYCENCGGSLQLRRTPSGGPIGRVGGVTVAGCVGCGSSVGDDGYCETCGRAQPTGRDRMEYDLDLVAGVSDRGRARARNEDSMAFGVVGPPGAPRSVVAVVCDGVGSTERADAASQAGVDAALEAIVDSLLAESTPRAATEDGAAAAYAAVGELARPNSPDTAPSCTFVSAVVTPSEITVGWIGDSRAYWVPSSPDVPSRRLTTDDTLVAQLVAAGMDEAEAAASLNAHALARWVGADAEQAPPHVTVLQPEAPGRLILCSDGLWNYLPEAESLAAKVSDAEPLKVAAELTSIANELGGHDNITVVVIPVEGPLAGPSMDTEGKVP
ncbi:protein phosphatase 2C domain-containing protein [Kibdelosporangium persicum]|uniref:Magnesium or manganese-dependent protein phosphatase n=1 Tax=Kibdelosporangium persicum TaxID=2698649 RepID=A0ABX2FGM1_9PSEU|nr:protein phosphatase 2C domain-containing protein [Kibdelosporangium persicum]NRN69961.1 Magnesium or manganese-dependent protein phosphatase [Kibdelosporangium persicum]